MVSSDKKYMKRALSLARKGIGRTSPNPAVGCVIVKNGVIVGEGWHKRAGGHHAEIHALEMAGAAGTGSGCVCHTGALQPYRQDPPCSEALIRAGVKRVVAGMRDPNPLGQRRRSRSTASWPASRRCAEYARKNAASVNLPFIKHVTTGVPYVTYKCAMTLDGNIATDHRRIPLDKLRGIPEIRASDAFTHGCRHGRGRHDHRRQPPADGSACPGEGSVAGDCGHAAAHSRER